MTNFNKKYLKIIAFLLIMIFFVSGCSLKSKNNNEENGNNDITKKGTSPEIPKNLNEKKKEIISRYEDRIPEEWGEDVSGVINKIDTDKKVIALTLDACGGGGLKDGYDKKLINFLSKENIPATLFINYRWIDANQEVFMELSKNSLFTIGNHGYRHLPLSLEGKSVYDIEGTDGIEEVVDEVMYNELKIEKLTGKKPKYFRTGTAYYDEVAVEIVNELGEKVIGYDILGDAGATFNKKQVKKAFLNVEPGSIILAHMNHPESETAEGIIAAVPELKKRGFKFVKLEDYDNKLISK
ncbi:MAG: polysaccharide deacetylase family protein [Bacillota bacterium]